MRLQKSIENEIPGLKAVNAVDAAGTFTFSNCSERYTPYNPVKYLKEIWQ